MVEDRDSLEGSDSSQSGRILEARDHGTIWEVAYRRSDGGTGLISFDHRCFAQFYEGAVGRSFFEDYRFGAGRQRVSEALSGLRISVEGEPFNEVVRLEAD